MHLQIWKILADNLSDDQCFSWKTHSELTCIIKGEVRGFFYI